MQQEYWVVGGRYRDVSFTHLEGGAEAYGPFARYEDALSSWSSHSARTRSFAAVRYSVVSSVRQGQGEAARPAGAALPRAAHA